MKEAENSYETSVSNTSSTRCDTRKTLGYLTALSHLHKRYMWTKRIFGRKRSGNICKTGSEYVLGQLDSDTGIESETPSLRSSKTILVGKSAMFSQHVSPTSGADCNLNQTAVNLLGENKLHDRIRDLHTYIQSGLQAINTINRALLRGCFQ